MNKREIKFRGKFVKKLDSLYPAENKWVYGYFYKESSGCWIKDGLSGYKVRPESIGQYTGFKDKSGVEIYEGDILCGDNAVVVWCGANGSWLVKYKDTFGQHYPSLWLFAKRHEVIGNQLDNSELLGENYGTSSKC